MNGNNYYYEMDKREGRALKNTRRHNLLFLVKLKKRIKEKK